VRVRLGDHLDFGNGSGPPERGSGHVPVYGANGPIGFAARANASGPLIVIGRVGSYCGTVRYCDSDVWVTDNAFVCRAKDPDETRYWYYALRSCRLNEHRSGSGQPLLNQRVLRDVVARVAAADQRRQIGGLLGAFDDKIAANRRVIDAAEALMVAMVEPLDGDVPLGEVASRAGVALRPGEFDDGVAHFSFAAFDDGAWPQRVDSASIRSAKVHLSAPCVLVSKLNPRTPRIWDVAGLPAEMAVASAEFVVLRPLGVGTSALWSALRQRGVSQALQQKVAGTSQSRQRIRQDELMEVAVRDVRRLSDDNARTTADLGALCHARRGESATLARVRDDVLALLTAGKIRVGDPIG
ncbi:restriction endonuclease subunit S, partial [Mycobacterium rhizamassiliense]|jgi:hypothetical protein